MDKLADPWVVYLLCGAVVLAVVFCAFLCYCAVALAAQRDQELAEQRRRDEARGRMPLRGRDARAPKP